MPSPLLATHTSSPETATPRGSEPTSIGPPCGRPLLVLTRLTVPAAVSVTQIESVPAATPIGEPPSWVVPPGSPLEASRRVRVPSPLLATQIEPPPVAMPSGASPTGIGSPCTRPEESSTRLTVPSPVLVTHTEPPRADDAVGVAAHLHRAARRSSRRRRSV